MLRCGLRGENWGFRVLQLGFRACGWGIRVQGRGLQEFSTSKTEHHQLETSPASYLRSTIRVQQQRSKSDLHTAPEARDPRSQKASS